jgi:plasmid stability protein
MTDVLIEGVPEEVAAALDARAARLGMSRSEYIRRLLAREAAAGPEVSPADLAWFAGFFASLADSEVMARAWQ